jgi:hypothetical protein
LGVQVPPALQVVERVVEEVLFRTSNK